MTTVTSPSKTNIEEANKHLQALYARVHDLERTIDSQNRELGKKDEIVQIRLQELETRKDSEISKLQTKLQLSEQKVQNLITITRGKDNSIARLQLRCRQLDEIMKYKPLIESLHSVMSSNSNRSSQDDSITEEEAVWKRRKTPPKLPKASLVNGQVDSEDEDSIKEMYL